jgi:hypothetical protein
MQNAETVLEVLRERGRRGLPCDEHRHRSWHQPQVPGRSKPHRSFVTGLSLSSGATSRHWTSQMGCRRHIRMPWKGAHVNTDRVLPLYTAMPERRDLPVLRRVTSAVQAPACSGRWS